MIGVELAQYLPNITISAWWYDTVTCQIEHNTLESNDSVNSPRINWNRLMLLLAGQQKNRGHYSQQQKDTYLHTFFSFSQESATVSHCFTRVTRSFGSGCLGVFEHPFSAIQALYGTGRRSTHCSTACGGRTTGPHQRPTSVCRWCARGWTFQSWRWKHMKPTQVRQMRDVLTFGIWEFGSWTARESLLPS